MIILDGFIASKIVHGCQCARNTRSIRKMPDNGITYREGISEIPRMQKLIL